MLTRLDIFRLFLKFVGLLIVMQAIYSLVYALLLFPSETKALTAHGLLRDIETFVALIISRLGYYVVQFLLGLGIIWWSSRTFRRLAADEPLAKAAEATDFQSVEAILYGLLGTYFIIEGTAWLAGILISGFANTLMNRTSFGDHLLIEITSGLVLGCAAKIMFGIVLILRKNDMAALRVSVAGWIRTARRWPT